MSVILTLSHCKAFLHYFLSSHLNYSATDLTAPTLQGEIHDAGIQSVHLRVDITVDAEDLGWLLLLKLWWMLMLMRLWFDEVRDRVERWCLSRSWRCGCDPGLRVKLQLELMVNS